MLCVFNYSRIIDWKKFKDIAKEVNAYLLADISHISALIIAGLHPDPFPYADVVMTTLQKQTRGARGAIILCNDEEIAKKLILLSFLEFKVVHKKILLLQKL